MFTGIIEQLGEIKAISASESNITFTVEAAFTSELKVDQSVAHNGVCLTVTSIKDNTYTVTAIQETLKKARSGDVILIAGKGHEDYQIVGTQKFPFSDVKVAEEALQER